MGLFLMVLGFMWWWPLGFIILAALIANGRIGYRRRLQFAGMGRRAIGITSQEWTALGRKRIAFPPRRTACATAPEGIGGVNHQAAIMLSRIVALDVAPSRTEQRDSRNS